MATKAKPIDLEVNPEAVSFEAYAPIRQLNDWLDLTREERRKDPCDRELAAHEKLLQAMLDAQAANVRVAEARAKLEATRIGAG